MNGDPNMRTVIDWSDNDDHLSYLTVTGSSCEALPGSYDTI